MATVSGHLYSEIILGILCVLTSVSCGSAATECFYHVEQIYEFRFLGSFFCDHGCCGTTENQRCCSKEEEGSAWKIVAIVMACVLGTIAVALVCYWLLKKQNRKTMRVRHANNQVRAPANISTAPNSRETFAMSHVYCKPPPYTLPRYTESPNGRVDQFGSTSGVCPSHDDLTATRQAIQAETTVPPPYTP